MDEEDEIIIPPEEPPEIMVAFEQSEYEVPADFTDIIIPGR